MSLYVVALSFVIAAILTDLWYTRGLGDWLYFRYRMWRGWRRFGR